MDPLTVPLLLLALLVGLVLGWALASRRGAATTAAQRARLAAQEAQIAELREAVSRQDDLRRDAVEHARHDREAAEERARRESAVLQALSPVRESLHRMQQRVDELERERQSQFGSLSEQLRRSQQADEALRATTESLAGALRSHTTRGVWGETQLRRVIEAAGLLRHVDFDEQATLSLDAGAGRPDLVVRMPGGTSIAVDAKAPLGAFLDAMAIPEGETDANGSRRDQLLGKHVKAVRAHVDALAKKAYWAGLDSSPEFVVCFIPSEAVLGVALEHDPSLLDHAFSQRVALASPVSLWAVLKTVAYTWRQHEVTAEARTLFDLGNQLYDRLGSLAGHADTLRRSIERTVEAYNQFAGSLESRVLVTARKFPGLDASRLERTPAPAAVERTTRRMTAAELIEGRADDEVA
jgi:DNA recombination protein RmuC